MYFMRELSILKLNVIWSEIHGQEGGLSFIPSKQLTDLLTKAAPPKMFSILCNKLNMIDIYAHT